MATGSPPKYGLSSRFSVEVDGVDLGHWAKCSGLEVSFTTQQYVELGNNTHTHFLPKGASYSNLTLERACEPADTANVQQWLSTMVDDRKKRTGKVTLNDATNQPVYTWNLRDVYPVRWMGPTFAASVSEVATEQLVLAHEGFLE